MSRGGTIGRIRAVILTTQRTGSTFLVECLDSHPAIDCASEILIGAPDTLRPPYRGPFRQLVKVANVFTSGAWRPARRMEDFFSGGFARVRAFKAMYNQLVNPFALRFLRDNEDIKILHLRRDNLLKVHVSRLLMTKRDHVQALQPVETIQTHVEPHVALEAMRKARARYERFESVFRRHPRLQLTYERLFDGQQLDAQTAREICGFLGVTHHPMESSIIKLNPESLRDMVTNYDELVREITRTEFADMLQ